MNKLSPEMPELQSMNITADNITKLKSLFPEAFNEDSVDFEVLKQLLGENVDDKEERYGLNWHGKRQARQLALTPSRGTLRPCKDESVDWHNTKNLMIEGDNLEVLKLLQKSYAGKVKLIYIDPPYNTGKGFVVIVTLAVGVHGADQRHAAGIQAVKIDALQRFFQGQARAQTDDFLFIILQIASHQLIAAK